MSIVVSSSKAAIDLSHLVRAVLVHIGILEPLIQMVDRGLSFDPCVIRFPDLKQGPHCSINLLLVRFFEGAKELQFFLALQRCLGDIVGQRSEVRWMENSQVANLEQIMYRFVH